MARAAAGVGNPFFFCCVFSGREYKSKLYNGAHSQRVVRNQSLASNAAPPTTAYPFLICPSLFLFIVATAAAIISGGWQQWDGGVAPSPLCRFILCRTEMSCRIGSEHLRCLRCRWVALFYSIHPRQAEEIKSTFKWNFWDTI